MKKSQTNTKEPSSWLGIDAIALLPRNNDRIAVQLNDIVDGLLMMIDDDDDEQIK